MSKIHGSFALRYAVFSLTALFLTACADPDNPVVYTAPAGKAVDEDEEVKQPPGPNHGSEVEIPPPTSYEIPPSLEDPPETAALQTSGNQGTNSQTPSIKLVGNSQPRRSGSNPFNRGSSSGLHHRLQTSLVGS